MLVLNKKVIYTSFNHANKALLDQISTNFQEKKSEHWTKPGSEFLFNFVEIFVSEVFIEGTLDIYFYDSINQKILLTVKIKNEI